MSALKKLNEVYHTLAILMSRLSLPQWIDCYTQIIENKTRTDQRCPLSRKDKKKLYCIACDLRLYKNNLKVDSLDQFAKKLLIEDLRESYMQLKEINEQL